MNNEMNYIEQNYPLFKNGTSNRSIRHILFKQKI